MEVQQPTRERRNTHSDQQQGRRGLAARQGLVVPTRWQIVEQGGQSCSWPVRQQLVDGVCLLYTSDAADDWLVV